MTKVLVFYSNFCLISAHLIPGTVFSPVWWYSLFFYFSCITRYWYLTASLHIYWIPTRHQYIKRQPVQDKYGIQAEMISFPSGPNTGMQFPQQNRGTRVHAYVKMLLQKFQRNCLSQLLYILFRMVNVFVDRSCSQQVRFSFETESDMKPSQLRG